MQRTLKLSESQLRNIIRETIGDMVGEDKSIHKVYTGKDTGWKYHVDINLTADADGALSGDWEYSCDGNDDIYASGSIRIWNGVVEDFDGAYDLPKRVKRALESAGYSIDW